MVILCYNHGERTKAMRNLRAHAIPRYFADAIDIYLYEKMHDGSMLVLSKIEFSAVDKDDAVIEPMHSILLPRETAQELMDALWQCGLRPSEGTGSAGALKATQDNLDDMRKFANRLLSIVEKG